MYDLWGEVSTDIVQLRNGAAGQLVKLPPTRLTCHMGARAGPAALLAIQFPANGLGTAEENGPKCLRPYNPHERSPIFALSLPLFQINKSFLNYFKILIPSSPFESLYHADYMSRIGSGS